MKINIFKKIAQIILQMGLLLMISFYGLSSCSSGEIQQKDDPGDTTAPGEVTNLTLTTIGGGSMTVTWSDPADSDLDHIEISVDPADITTVIVANGTGSATLNGLTTKKGYTYTIKSVDTSDNHSAGTSIIAFMPVNSATVTYISSNNAANFHALLADDVTNDTGGYYILQTDIDLTGYGSWDALGDDTKSFSGTLDGGGHTLSNLSKDQYDAINMGLFGYVGTDGAVFRVALDSVNIANSDDTVGAIVGYNYGVVMACSASGSITGNTNVGGLVGLNNGGVIKSSANVVITIGSQIGGLVGFNSGAINNCYAIGNVGDALYSTFAGGLVGINGGGVFNCYSSGAVAGTGNLGGLVALNMGTGGTVSGSYYNSTLAGQTDAYATGNIDLTIEVNFTGWDFTDIWAIDSSINSGYPYLQ